jgi:hypothetical protein
VVPIAATSGAPAVPAIPEAGIDPCDTVLSHDVAKYAMDIVEQTSGRYGSSHESMVKLLSLYSLEADDIEDAFKPPVDSIACDGSAITGYASKHLKVTSPMVERNAAGCRRLSTPDMYTNCRDSPYASADDAPSASIQK